MQQYLPLAVLKRTTLRTLNHVATTVAIVLTAYGIETSMSTNSIHNLWIVATVLTACGIETKEDGD